MNTIEIVVRGRVQGVFFRKYTVMKAEELNLDGFVRNEPDGSVYIVAQGADEILKHFIEWCHTGSPVSKVESVDVQNIDANIDETGFHIQRTI